MDSNTIYNIALEYFQKKDYQNAMLLCSDIISKDPNHLYTYLLLGNIFYILKDYSTAKEFLNIAIKLKEDFFDAYFLLGAILKENNELEESIRIWNKALKIRKTSVIYSNIAASFLSLEKYEEAKKYVQKALKKDSKNLQALSCNYKIYKNQVDIKNTKKMIENLLKYYPEDAEANFDYSDILLIEKDYKKGFKYYEYRKKLPSRVHEYNYLPFKAYNGEDLTNKTLLIYHEQGFGDNIHFGRFLNYFTQKNINVLIVIQNPLKKLFEYNFPNLKFIDKVNSNESIDYCLSLMSIPYVFSINTISPKSYFQVNELDVISFKNKYLKNENKNIGICWEGSKSNRNSLKLDVFKKIFELKNVNIFSFQYKTTENLKEYNIISLDEYINDFYDNAVAIKSMDYIISIDTSIAHLSGALGIKTTVLKRDTYICFRWMKDENNNSLWYECIKPKSIDNIQNTIDEVIKEINGL